MINWKSHRLHLLLQLVLTLALVWLAFQLADRFRVRVDMTEEDRFSLTDQTKNLLNRLDEDVYVDVYLGGELPSNFLRFQKSIRETLEEFSIYAATTINYRFIDPSVAKSTQARNRYYQDLINRGLQPTNLSYSKDGQNSQKWVFPGVILSYRGRETAINLLKGNRTSSPDEMINQAIEGIEYELASGIIQLSELRRKKVGLVVGHNEPDTTQLAGFTNLILSKYDLYRLNLPEKNTAITGYDLLVVAKPTTGFSDREKFLLDQYVMKGGKLLFFLDALSVNMDSASGDGTVAIPYQTNLTDLLFKYGVRINQDYVTDLNCGDFPIVAGNIGNQPQIRMLPWPYFPVITNYGTHPAVRNLDAVMMRFTSSMDTVKAMGIKKTPLLLTSAHTKVIGAPIQVSFNDLKSDLLPDKFQAGPKVLGYLLEGPFTSLYKNKFPPRGFDRNKMIDEGTATKIVVLSDGDLIRNELSLEDGTPLSLGVEPYSQARYANEDLILNLVDYLMDEEGIIQSRTKEIKIRPLDKVRVKEERLKWQLINLVAPVLLLLVFGVVKMFVRKSKNKF
ncbi:gliding motility-associated ABC transporter substrate-binding protein GldG [Marinoscillum sp. MHG1-6]|uniref:gliding motility-associated ABC transporter substrate-binding protein GldG n=1 Tax=Marinoscillum sp. MHG1-6 TaxID=2959627 RepID=UPI00215713EB|nr:gliding motility-associated ABC transporter substrate-binding protein GldG [Marinoscillum sp. MHG1-6]